MNTLKLNKITLNTLWTWLGLLGFKYCKITKSYYTDGHKREDVVKYQNLFIKLYLSAEVENQRWIQIPEAVSIKLEKNEDKDNFPRNCYHPYVEDSVVKMHKYHIDTKKY